MFEKKKEFPWRIPIMILVGILVLAGGIYVGFKTTDENISGKREIETKEERKKEDVKNTFNLSENCEIWVEKVDEDGIQSDEAPTMIGTIPSVLIGKSKDEISTYLKTKYPDKTIKKLDKYEITLLEKETFNDEKKANKFAIEDKKGLIIVCKYDKNGNREILENTQIETQSLPKVVQEKIKSGICLDDKEEIYPILEDFGS